MIPEVKVEEDRALIPILGSCNDYITITWKEDGDCVSPFKNGKYQLYCSLRSNICFDESLGDIDDISSQILTVYEIRDEYLKKDFLLIAFNEITDIDDIRHCVAVPHNYLNLIKFYKDYVMTFPDDRGDKLC